MSPFDWNQHERTSVFDRPREDIYSKEDFTQFLHQGRHVQVPKRGEYEDGGYGTNIAGEDIEGLDDIKPKFNVLTRQLMTKRSSGTLSVGLSLSVLSKMVSQARNARQQYQSRQRLMSVGR